MLKNPMYLLMQKTSTQRDWEDVELEGTELQGPYLGDDLARALYFWKPERAVILDAPTGCGKTTFVLNHIAKQAVKNRENILILVNRKILETAYKEKVAKMTGLSENYTDKGLAEETDFGNIFVTTYQNYRSFCFKHSHIKFSYLIADETHFFLADAMFNADTAFVLNDIPKTFEGAKRMYMTATPHNVLAYIMESETTALMGSKFIKNQKILGSFLGLSKFNLPKVFRVMSDFSWLQLFFFDDEDALFDELSKKNDKSIIFTESIRHGNKIFNKIDSRMLISSPILDVNPDIAKSLIVEEKFDEKFLIATAVFSNGNNIKDDDVKNVVSFFADEVNLIQMLGRRRLDRKNLKEKISLYVFVPSRQRLKNKIEYLNEVLDEIKLCEENQKQLCSVILNGWLPVHTLIRNITHVKDKGAGYEINPLSVDAFALELRRTEKHLLQLTMDEGLFCQEFASIFGKDYDSSTMRLNFSLNKVEEFIKFLKALPKKFGQEDFDSVSESITNERIRLFGKSKADNTGGKRGALKITALNNRFAELNIPVRLKQEGNVFCFVWDEGGENL